MGQTHEEFQARLRSLGRKHRAMTKTGADMRLRDDGLIVVRPKRSVSAFGLLPIRGIAVLMICFFAFKGYLLASMDEAAYTARLTKLQAGTEVEQVGAHLMRPDAVSRLFARAIADLRS